MRLRDLGKTVSLAPLVVFGAIMGCNGNTAGGDRPYAGAQYSPDSAGRIELRVADDTLEVGRTTGFEASVFDSDGAPVPNIRITCDTELGLALVEPTTGSELTGVYGAISGVVGCAARGSLQLGCRLPGDTDIRKFVTVKCTGQIPDGFAGFPGAGGGNLGGGVAGSSGVRITGVSLFTINSGTSSTTSVDTTQGTCTSSGTPTAEPFGDDSLEVTIVNGGFNSVRFNKYSYVVSEGRENGSDYRSPELSIPDESATAQPNSTSKIRFLAFDASSDGKLYADSTTAIPSALGFRSVTITLKGVSDNGDEVEVTAGTTLSFDNFNACSSGS